MSNEHKRIRSCLGTMFGYERVMHLNFMFAEKKMNWNQLRFMMNVSTDRLKSTQTQHKTIIGLSTAKLMFAVCLPAFYAKSL